MSRAARLKWSFSYLVYILILGMCVPGFFIMGAVYFKHNPGTGTVVLENSLFPDQSLAAAGAGGLEIKNVLKADTSYPIWNAAVLDQRTILFPVYDQKRRSNVIYALDLNTNASAEMDYPSGPGFIISPDGKKLLTGNAGKENDALTTDLYDIPAKTMLRKYSGITAQMFLDNNRFIATSRDSIMIRDVNSAVEVKYKAGSGIQSKQQSDLKFDNYNALFNFKRSADGKSFYFQGVTGSNVALYRADIEQPGTVDKLAEGKLGYAVAADRNLLIIGSQNGETGLFLYNGTAGAFKQLVQGNVYTAAAAADGKIAYIATNQKLLRELHVAVLDGERLKADQVVYSDLQSVGLLEWSPNDKMLFCVSTGLNGSSIFRFTF